MQRQHRSRKPGDQPPTANFNQIPTRLARGDVNQMKAAESLGKNAGMALASAFYHAQRRGDPNARPGNSFDAARIWQAASDRNKAVVLGRFLKLSGDPLNFRQWRVVARNLRLAAR